MEDAWKTFLFKAILKSFYYVKRKENIMYFFRRSDLFCKKYGFINKSALKNSDTLWTQIICENS